MLLHHNSDAYTYSRLFFIHLLAFLSFSVKGLTEELFETEKLLRKLEDSKQSQMYAIRDIEEIKERLLSFGKYAKDAQLSKTISFLFPPA